MGAESSSPLLPMQCAVLKCEGSTCRGTWSLAAVHAATHSQASVPDSAGVPQGRWRIYGVGLPDSILKKVYSTNAERLLGARG